MCQNIMNFCVFGFTNRPECDIIYCAGYTPDFGVEDVIADEALCAYMVRLRDGAKM